jgi:hypothetical protein
LTRGSDYAHFVSRVDVDFLADFAAYAAFALKARDHSLRQGRTPEKWPAKGANQVS